MSNDFKKGDKVVYAPEMYDLQDAVFLNKWGDEGFIRLCDTLEIKRVRLTHLHPVR